MIFDAVVGARTLRIEVRAKEGGYRLLVDGKAVEVEARETGRGFLGLLLDGRSYDVGLHPTAQNQCGKLLITLSE